MECFGNFGKVCLRQKGTRGYLGYVCLFSTLWRNSVLKYMAPNPIRFITKLPQNLYLSAELLEGGTVQVG